ncbi:MAG: type 4a pilus biogenesis protein PilO [Deltaproteobacteria bacterium]|nr:type 4a pilus biogenesis protein PilO [Deltaproteobacteria bacterium]
MADPKPKASGFSLDRLSLPGKVAVGAIMLVLIGVTYFVLFYGDVESGIEAARQQLDAKRAELLKAQESKKQYNRDVAEKARREQLLAKQKKILPDSSESPAFLSTIQNVATVSGIKLTSWTPMEEVPEQYYAKVPMGLTLVGRFHQIAKFFFSVGAVDRIINMENIVIGVDQQQAALQMKKVYRAGPGGLEEEEPGSDIAVECLATAFRALTPGESGSRRAKRKEAGH